MKKLYLLAIILITVTSHAQQFSTDSYLQFRNEVKGLSHEQLQSMYARPADRYIKGFENINVSENTGYLDSMKIKLELTPGELNLLNQNLFMVSERLNYHSFGDAFHSVYYYDLPVFISTDAILHALHMSYDQILMNIEREIMSANLEEFLKSLYDNFGELELKYGESEELADALKDADIYVTIAYSLITDQLQDGHVVSTEKLNELWNAIESKKAYKMALFTYPYRLRTLDFSQFTVRGHYVYTQEDQMFGLKSLEPYFRAMMWLGRTDFLLTPPPENPWEEPWSEKEILRMNLGAFMLNELVQNSEQLDLLKFNETVIDFLVGNSDNITPKEYQSILDESNLTSAEQLLDTTIFHGLIERYNADPELAQEILSDIFLMNPGDSVPGVLPISYRVSGQRFIIDSYVLGNLVFDRLIFNGNKIMRMMPKAMDALFPLGNNDVLPLLEEEFNKYPYAEQMANMRYLVDGKTEDFWTGSLYNVWLNSIRKLNPVENSKQPLFMQTAAWHQEKINTQMASWSQLRHDNLLYAKQSYTGGTGCSFPNSYIEPYPEFYANLKQFAENAGNFFSQLTSNSYEITRIVQFFPNFAEIMGRLEELATKELQNIPFTNEENEWLKSMLFREGGSGTPPYSGWYTNLFFDKWDAAEGDFTVVDIHTQPTDEWGNPVGYVLHTGIGYVNLGVFLVNCPDSKEELMAFAGPVMSYYEKITEDFKRMTDQEWEQLVDQSKLPERPDWTNIYLADINGEIKENGTELPSKLYTGIIEIKKNTIDLQAYPNPVAENLTINLNAENDAFGEILVYNSVGVLIQHSEVQSLVSGRNQINVSFKGFLPGLYIVKVKTDNKFSGVLKVIKK